MSTPARDLITIIGDIKENTETLNKISEGLQECVDKSLALYQFDLVCAVGCEAEKRGSELMKEFNEAMDQTNMIKVTSGTLGMYMYFLSQHNTAHEKVCKKLDEILHITTE